jgi:ADP-ribose pyrophosphatase YjhB (NUDIX family)
MHQMRQRLSAGVIVEHNDRILLVRHVRPGIYDFWVAPGGGVQGTETLSAAAEREACEESGLTVGTGMTKRRVSIGRAPRSAADGVLVNPSIVLP